MPRCEGLAAEVLYEASVYRVCYFVLMSQLRETIFTIVISKQCIYTCALGIIWYVYNPME